MTLPAHFFMCKNLDGSKLNVQRIWDALVALYETKPYIKLVNAKLPKPESRELSLFKKEGYDLYYNDKDVTSFVFVFHFFFVLFF